VLCATRVEGASVGIWGTVGIIDITSIGMSPETMIIYSLLRQLVYLQLLTPNPTPCCIKREQVVSHSASINRFW
jgi:hypothetical protein